MKKKWKFQNKYKIITFMYKNVDLKNKNTSYFISKMGLFGKSRGIVIQDTQAIANTIGKSSQQRRDHYRENGGNWESFF